MPAGEALRRIVAHRKRGLLMLEPARSEESDLGDEAQAKLQFLNVSAELEQMRSYIERGRPLRSWTETDLCTAYVQEMRSWAAEPVHRDRRGLYDVNAESSLRKIALPHEIAAPYLEHIKQTLSGIFRSLPPENRTEIVAKTQREYEAAHGQMN